MPLLYYMSVSIGNQLAFWCCRSSRKHMILVVHKPIYDFELELDKVLTD
jgi:hypothetical protein